MARRARQVQIDPDALEHYAKALPVEELRDLPLSVEGPEDLEPEETAAFILVLDAVNFGSGYFPHLRKRPGLSGYRTIEASVREWWRRSGRLSPERLRAADAPFCADVFGQSLADEAIRELMQLFAEAWHQLGGLLGARHDDDPIGPIRAAQGSASRLVEELCRMPFFLDVSRYGEMQVPFLKRAQISVHDLALTVPGPLGEFEDLDRLTIFADNPVPHVLRLDGVLLFEPDLVDRIDRGIPLEHDSPEEVEIRACAVHATERIVQVLTSSGRHTTPRELDQWLWNRGQDERYKARPRHRSRTVSY